MRQPLDSGTGDEIPTLFILMQSQSTHKLLFRRGNGGRQDSFRNKMAHIGNLIQQELERQHLSRTWLARHIYCSRPNINKIVSRPHIDTESLTLISHALNHNFFADLAADYDSQSPTCNPSEL